MASSSDWDKVTILRKKPPRAGALRSEQAVNAARRQGLAVDTQPKRGGGGNKKPAAQGAVNAAKLDAETEELRHERVSLDLGKRLQQSRLVKGWTQKELATKINEKPQVVNEYEAGRAIPNPAVIAKMEKALGTKLRGKERAAATASAPAVAAAAAAGPRRR